MIGYINSSSFPVYTYGEMVVVKPYHIRWTPSDISSGTFSIDGSTYNFSDYSGEFLFYKNSITNSAFKENLDITTIDTDVNTIGQAAFGYCYNLSEVSLSNVTSIAYRAFFSCYALSSVYLPECSIVGAQAFGWCSGMTSISLPKCGALYNRALYRTSISEIYLPVCSNISSQAFYNCLNLSTITLGGSSVCRLLSSDGFEGTGITSSTGLIYVPDSLYESYVEADQWSYFFNRIRPYYWSENYIRWTPSDYSGYSSYTTFSIEGNTYNYSDYSGYFSGFFTITSAAFFGASFTSIDTNTSYIDRDGFGHCESLTSVSLPNCEYLERTAFYNCFNLSTVNLPVCGHIGSSCFWINILLRPYSSGLFSLTLGSSTVCELSLQSSTSTIHNDLGWITSRRGYICVPSSLVSDYKADSVWSYYSNRIFPIDGQEYYISWTPSNISSGTFNVGGWDFNFSEYSSGYFSMYESFIIGYVSGNYYSSGFANNSIITAIETNATIIRTGAFANCTSLSYVNLPGCQYIGRYVGSVFANCTSLISINLPECKYVGEETFTKCYSLTNVSLPKCEYIWSAAFNDCYALSSISLPMCISVGYRAFVACRSLSSVYLPSCLSIDENAFGGCSLLSNIELPVCSYIGAQAFRGAGLQTITLGNSSICTLSGSKVFYSCPISGIFVPSDLVNGYKIAPNWSYYSLIIYPIPS